MLLRLEQTSLNPNQELISVVRKLLLIQVQAAIVPAYHT
jgi:hypothetical protein